VLSSAELTLLADEIQRLAVPSRVDKVHQPARDRILLRLATDAGDRALLIVASRSFARAHLVEDAPQIPRTPPPFCEDLRRLLTPGRLVRAATLPGDAVLVLEFEVRGDGAVEKRRLVAELFGARPNVVVLAPDGTILAVLAPREGGPRPFLPGERYVEPRRPAKDLAPKPPFADLGGPPAPTLSRALELAVSPRESLALLDESRTSVLDALGQEEKKLRRRLANIEADVRGAEEIPRLKREGEILKAHLGEMKRGMKHLDAADWSAGGERVRIALDPMRTPKEEVAHRFDEARRLERLKVAAAERLAEVDVRLRALDAFAARAREAASDDEIAAIRAEAGFAERAQPALPGKKAPPPKPEPRKPYRTFVSKDGIEMLVGRTASDNDELTFQVANGNDFWFHVRDYPGSHVVIRAREQLPEETLLDAATLAVHFSRADAAGKRDVSWTRRKFVSKARGAPAGQVLLSAHKTIHLRVEPERLKRLLKG
jgi:predicted ribosome quality control (RQC) complex YloA/Tae2 family protein